MNEYIISPWVFYWIDIVNQLPFILLLIVLALLLFAVYYFFQVQGCNDDQNICMRYLSGTDNKEVYERHMSESQQKEKHYTYMFKLCVAAMLFTGVLTVLVPSEETLYKMVIASQVTTENIETAKDTIKYGVDYIFEKIGELE